MWSKCRIQIGLIQFDWGKRGHLVGYGVGHWDNGREQFEDLNALPDAEFDSFTYIYRILNAQTH